MWPYRNKKKQAEIEDKPDDKENKLGIPDNNQSLTYNRALIGDLSRLVVLMALIIGSWFFIYNLTRFEIKHTVTHSQSKLMQEDNDALNRVSPVIGACYTYGAKSTGIIIAGAIGIALGIAYVFGTYLYKIFREYSTDERQKFWKAVEQRGKAGQERS
ncbi:hypothetical protein JDN40_05270 [Rhodomicrobium vannielii ATCC 17100]|uniref:hypothetical protein n=1 Tax=Rhodomicrobium vannielii TaxID=1069 RepID=UPI0019193C49|nr:hypothetical protein [Rhodomicrobium vannielii]MBJ7533514.1 hypothetical protein [Rhodomicrobium vannielii ATCC 17100]